MTIILFSDIHGNAEALKSILEDIQSQQYDKVIFLGDAIGIGPSSKECIDLLKKMHIDCVLGNHESYYLNPNSIDSTYNNVILHHKWISNSLDTADKEFIQKWNKYIDIELAGKKIRASHFVFEKNSDKFYSTKVINTEDAINDIFKDDFDLYVIGHKHTPFLIEKDGKQIIDIGSSGCVDNNLTFYTILKTSGNIIEIYKKYIEYNREELVNKILSKNYPARKYFGSHYFNLDVKE